MTDYLHKITYQVLHIEKKGVSKVRLAKLLYFTHKQLVLSEKVENKMLKFIRMPLGPVPLGFKNLHEDINIKVETLETSFLLYNSQHYSLLRKQTGDLSDNNLNEIKSTLFRLNRFQTSELIDLSHNEPSWKAHRNGNEYFITREDLKVHIPRKKSVKTTDEAENQHIQAKLVDGMLEDIVDESTLLEYPEIKK